MMSLTLENLEEFLKNKKFNVELEPETKQLYIKFNFEGQEFLAFMRVYEGSDLLQLLLFIPYRIKHGTEEHLARLLHLINKEIDIPGFGMDETEGVIFYRCMLPAHNKKIEPALIESFLNSLELISKTFTPVIAAVALGQATYKEILQKLQTYPETTER